MQLYDLVLDNREILMLFYTIIIGMICFRIVIRTDKLFRLSFHQGIRYFRNAFFFYGIAFVSRYLLGTTPINVFIMKAIFEFFLGMAGFFLLYSLLWKKIESQKKESFSSLLNSRIVIFYIFALIIVILDYLWNTYSFLFVSQIVSFIIAAIISGKYSSGKKKSGFLKLYFLVIILNLFAWLLNFAVAVIFHWNQIGVINIYVLNMFIFLLFLYCVINATKKSVNIGK